MSAQKPRRATKSYMRRGIANDSSLCHEARALLQSMDNRFLPAHLACAFPRVMNQIARLWHRPAQLDEYFDDLLIDGRGTRQGFPFVVASELNALKHYYQAVIYPKRECVWDKVYSTASDLET
jgi:hypothetical protein